VDIPICQILIGIGFKKMVFPEDLSRKGFIRISTFLRTVPKFGRLLTVAFTVRNDKIRVISARPMSRKERRRYGSEEKI
jgi:uncharacterized DUF497 family protein